jgi:hypothetical protein
VGLTAAQRALEKKEASLKVNDEQRKHLLIAEAYQIGRAGGPEEKRGHICGG